MTTSHTAPHEFGEVYAALKDFQRATVEHVAGRFFGDDPARRYLVADEVGLGKTLVATGVVARAIEHHQRNGTERIDVVYVCSNADIARQNTKRLVARLRIPGVDRVRPINRITLLPHAIHDLKRRQVNFVALTPGTSFDLKSSEGRKEERALLWGLLRRVWGRHAVDGNPALRVFAGWASFDGFVQLAQRARRRNLDEALVADFKAALEREDLQAREAGRPTLPERLEDLPGPVPPPPTPGRRPAG